MTVWVDILRLRRVLGPWSVMNLRFGFFMIGFWAVSGLRCALDRPDRD
jgi:hypothetical protein